MVMFFLKKKIAGSKDSNFMYWIVFLKKKSKFKNMRQHKIS